MIAIEIKINGRIKAVCGAEDLDRVFASIHVASGSLRLDDSDSADATFMIECVGQKKLAADSREFLQWIKEPISEEDEISIRFVRADKPHDPIDRYTFSRPATGQVR